MSEKGVELLRLAERGARIKKVRESAEMTGAEFAKRLNALAADRGLAVSYDDTKLSRLEGGKATYLPAEDAVLIVLLDPECRSVEWLVVADEMKSRGAKPIAKKATAAASSRNSSGKRDAK